MHRRKANGRGGIAAEGLDQRVSRRHLPQLAAHGTSLLVIGDHPNMGTGRQRGEALVSLLEQGLLPDDVEQLFWQARAAARPKTGSSPAGKNDGVSGWRRRTHWRRIAGRWGSLSWFSAGSCESCSKSGT